MLKVDRRRQKFNVVVG